MQTRWCAQAGALLIVALQAACGGSDEGQDPSGGRPQANRGAPEALFAQDGRPSAAARQPAEGWNHRTRVGLYATQAQYDWEALTVEPYTVLVDVDAHSSSAAAVAKALAGFRWSREGDRIAYYVRASDAGRSVEVADALADAGVPLVFVITRAGS